MSINHNAFTYPHPNDPNDDEVRGEYIIMAHAMILTLWNEENAYTILCVGHEDFSVTRHRAGDMEPEHKSFSARRVLLDYLLDGMLQNTVVRALLDRAIERYVEFDYSIRVNIGYGVEDIRQAHRQNKEHVAEHVELVRQTPGIALLNTEVNTELWTNEEIIRYCILKLMFSVLIPATKCRDWQHSEARDREIESALGTLTMLTGPYSDFFVDFMGESEAHTKYHSEGLNLAEIAYVFIEGYDYTVFFAPSEWHSMGARGVLSSARFA